MQIITELETNGIFTRCMTGRMAKVITWSKSPTHFVPWSFCYIVNYMICLWIRLSKREKSDQNSENLPEETFLIPLFPKENCHSLYLKTMLPVGMIQE